VNAIADQDQSAGFIAYIQSYGLTVTLSSGVYTITNGVLTLSIELPTTSTALWACLAPFVLVPEGRILNNTFYAWRGYFDVPVAAIGVIYWAGPYPSTLFTVWSRSTWSVLIYLDTVSDDNS